jgi:hypothetical protein
VRIALRGSIAWRTPPRVYGSWEQVAGLLADGLVAAGADVTLFATLDSVTTAHGITDPKIPPAYQASNSVSVSISDTDRDPGLTYAATVHHGVNVSGLPFYLSGGPGLVSFGRIHPDKGTHTAIEIARRAGRP